MEDPNKNEQLEKERIIKIGEELNALQAVENDGRGVGCVQGVVTYLKMGDLEKAKTWVDTDSDKMRNYDAIYAFLLKNGLREKDSGEV